MNQLDVVARAPLLALYYVVTELLIAVKIVTMVIAWMVTHALQLVGGHTLGDEFARTCL